MTNKELMDLAISARENSYSKYSGFSVGAALLTQSGKIYLGCNIENASFSPTCCAERTAFFSAIAAGEREFSAIAVCGGKTGENFGDFSDFIKKSGRGVLGYIICYGKCSVSSGSFSVHPPFRNYFAVEIGQLFQQVDIFH